MLKDTRHEVPAHEDGSGEFSAMENELKGKLAPLLGRFEAGEIEALKLLVKELKPFREYLSNASSGSEQRPEDVDESEKLQSAENAIQQLDQIIKGKVLMFTQSLPLDSRLLREIDRELKIVSKTLGKTVLEATRDLNEFLIELLSRAQYGDSGAFEHLINLYYDALMAFAVRTATRLGLPPEITEEWMANFVIDLLAGKLNSFDPCKVSGHGDGIGAWLFFLFDLCIKRNNESEFRGLNMLEKYKVQLMGDSEDLDPSHTVGDRLDMVDKVGRLRQFLKNEVSEETRQIYILRILQERSFDEVANLMNISSGAARTRISRLKSDFLRWYYEKKEQENIQRKNQNGLPPDLAEAVYADIETSLTTCESV